MTFCYYNSQIRATAILHNHNAMLNWIKHSATRIHSEATMAKKAASKHVEPEYEPQGTSESELQTSPRGTVSKAEAVRAAIDAGMKSPTDGIAYAMKHFGIAVTKPHFSAIKSNYKKTGGVKAPKGKPGRKPKAAVSHSVEGYLAPPPKQRSGGEGDLLETLETLKPLIASHGADKLKRLVDLLG